MSCSDDSYEPSSSGEGDTDYLDDGLFGRSGLAEDDLDHLQKYQEVQEQILEDIHIQPDVLQATKEAWSAFIASQSSRDAAGEAIYAAVFDSSPSLQSFFQTPRSVMALRFMNGLANIISIGHDPSALRAQVEALGFRHLYLEVTAARVAVFREAIVEVFEEELRSGLSPKGRMGLQALLNYAGGAYIYIRREYSARIKIIRRSWQLAGSQAGEREQDDESTKEGSSMKTVSDSDVASRDRERASTRRELESQGTTTLKSKSTATDLKVPTNFREMYLFNAAMMGFGRCSWMELVLDQFDDIVSNVSNSNRFQDECDVLSLVLAQHEGSVRLSEFRAVMLASLRALTPHDWDSEHEVAWNWLWENVERMLRTSIKPKAKEAALSRFILSLSENAVFWLRKEVYVRFFAAAPAGKDLFKQSTSRLYFIADKVIEMTLDMFRHPRRMVVDISALGLRHVGYEVPTELFPPFVSACVDVVRDMTKDEVAEVAFNWSLTLISKILVRTVLEGSTIVMKAINTNQEKALRRAVAVAPRGRRATELLEIRVGTQSISPLYWAIESGSLNCCLAMIRDLLTIRADRDNYYYGCDALFSRHPDIVQKLCSEAPGMLPALMDGLLWRSRLSSKGRRRVNYYIKNLLQDLEGNFNQTLEWLVDFKDPQLISHPSVSLVADIIWERLAMYDFLFGRLYFLMMLCVFAAGQAILHNRNVAACTEAERLAIFSCRCTFYLGSLCHMILREIRLMVRDCRNGAMLRFFGTPVPQFLCSAQELGNLLLALLLIFMCIYEPIWWCIDDMFGDFAGAGLFTTSCPAGLARQDTYGAFSCAAMLLYCLLILDLSILSMRFSSFVLLCGRVVIEVGLFLLAASFLVLSFALGISTLSWQSPNFKGLGQATFSLTAMTLGLYPKENLPELYDYLGVLVPVAVFTILVAIFLLNLLVAQLTQAYQLIFPDMQGYARLNRASVIVTTLAQVSQRRWSRFLASLRFQERLEFEEGDVGLAGGLQLSEPSGENPTTVDSIRRYGGSTSPSMPWPAEASLEDSLEDRFARLEKLILHASKGSTGRRKARRTSGVSTSGASSLGASSLGASSLGASSLGAHSSSSERASDRKCC